MEELIAGLTPFILIFSDIVYQRSGAVFARLHLSFKHLLKWKFMLFFHPFLGAARLLVRKCCI